MSTATMTLVRVPLTLAAALAFHVSMSAPTSDPDVPRDKRAVCATARLITATLSKGLYWASAVTDTLVLLAPHVPSALTTSVPITGALLAWTSKRGLGLFAPPLPLATIAGTTLALTGALLRRAAYCALGQFYACRNLGPGSCAPRDARNNAHRRSPGHCHMLITSGPYAFVRHPGYAGLLMCMTGLVMLQFDAVRGHSRLGGTSSWGGGERVSVGMRVVALVCAALRTLGAMRRIQSEEQALKTRFRWEWEAWARNVRYRLVPGVY